MADKIITEDEYDKAVKGLAYHYDKIDKLKKITRAYVAQINKPKKIKK